MDFFNEKKKLMTIISVIVIILLLIISAMFAFVPETANRIFGYITAPIQTGVSNIVDFFDNSRSDLENENLQLKEEIEQLKLDNSRLEHLDADNKELTDLLGTKQKFSQYNTIAARKIGQDFNNWDNTIIIDKGSNDGIAVDMVVIAQGALVGKVVSVTPFTSNIVTILDDTSSVSVVSARSNDIAFVKGDIGLTGTNTLHLEYLDSSTPMFVNDELFTSSISSLYPAGLSIGFVTEINVDANNKKTGIVQPIVDFDNLDTVLVINKVFSNKTTDQQTVDETVSTDTEVKWEFYFCWLFLY